MMSKTDPDEAYTPRAKENDPDPHESCIARRFSTRKGAIEFPKTPVPSDESFSGSVQSSNDESCDDFDTSVYRKSHSVLPNLNPVAFTNGNGSPSKSRRCM